MPDRDAGNRVVPWGHQLRVLQRSRKDGRVTQRRQVTQARSGTSATSTRSGYLYLTDRKSYMIISGGVNIYPQETENLLITHPKVMDAAVIGVPDEDLGEAVKAVVQPSPEVEPGPESRARTHRLLPGASGPLQVSAHRRLRRRASAAPDRQALQAASARPLLG